MAVFNFERAATILVEAAFFGDKRAAEKWGVTTRTLYNWRDRLDVDSLFSEFFNKKKETFERDWAASASPTIRSAIDFLQRSTIEADPRDPEAIHAIAGALKILAEVSFTKQLLDGRLADRR